MNKYVSKYITDLNRDNYYALCNKKYFSDKKLSVLEINEGIIVPPKKVKPGKSKDSLFGVGGVIDENGKYVDISAQLAKNMNNRIVEIKEFNEDYRVVHDDVIYMNFFIKQWGHYLIDVIGRLWYAIKNTNVKIVYTCYQDEVNVIDGNYLELLQLLGISKERLLLVNTPTKFDKVIVPEMAIYPGDYYTQEFIDIFDIIVKNSNIEQITNGKKIYCSRMNFGKNNIKEFGEDIIEKNLIDNGFTPVYMENLSLKEQIQLINNSEKIVMTCGSLSHNLLFNRSDNNVYILNKTYRINLHQFLVNDISKSKTYFIDVYVSPLPILYGYGPFIMRDTQEFDNFLLDNDMRVTCAVKKVSLSLKIKYYLKYFISYRNFLFRFQKIRESSNAKYEVEFKKIRKEYKKYLKSSK